MTTVDPAKLRSLVDRLRGVDMAEREMWENTPIGRMAHEAADELERLLPYAKLAMFPETEQEVEALEENTVARRALDLLCAIRGHESVVVKHETLVALRDEIERLRAVVELAREVARDPYPGNVKFDGAIELERLEALCKLREGIHAIDAARQKEKP